MTVNDIDKLFSFLYHKGSEYTKYIDIKRDCFSGDNLMDVEGMTIKMHKDGFLDSGAIHDHAVIIGYTQQGIYKLSFEGRMAFENCAKGLEGQPYRFAKRRQDRADMFRIVKIVAAVSNSILIIAIAAFGLLQNYQFDRKQQEIVRLTHTLDSLKQTISVKGNY